MFVLDLSVSGLWVRVFGCLCVYIFARVRLRVRECVGLCVCVRAFVILCFVELYTCVSVG